MVKGMILVELHLGKDLIKMFRSVGLSHLTNVSAAGKCLGEITENIQQKRAQIIVDQTMMRQNIFNKGTPIRDKNLNVQLSTLSVSTKKVIKINVVLNFCKILEDGRQFSMNEEINLLR